MAEILVLIVFCLLLLMGWTLRTSATGADATRELEKALGTLSDASGMTVVVPIPEDFLDLVRIGRKAIDRVKGTQVVATTSDHAADIDRFIDLGIAAESAFGQNTMNQPPHLAAQEFIRDAGEAYRAARDTTAYGSAAIWFQTLQKCADKCGKDGGDFPPCARTLDGKAALVFTATLRSDSIELRDNPIPELEAAKATWPVSAILFGQPLSETDFLNQTDAMFRWSEERSCRFFVDILDETGATEKMAYKLRLRTVERHFYKNESLR